MGIRIRNKTAKPIWLRLNSGRTISVFPRQTPPEIDENELDGNDAFIALLERNAIAADRESLMKKTTPAATKASHSKSKLRK